MTIDLNDLYLFTQVVERRGFTAAGDALGLPKSRISRRITQLEARLGARLLQRSSRRMNLTEAGQVLYKHCVAMVASALAGENAVRHGLDEPSGPIRVSLPAAITDIVLAPLLVRFMQHYPKVQLMVQASHRTVDLIEENMDVVVRGVGITQASSSLIQTPLCTVPWALVASPTYLTQSGPIDTLEALANAHALLYESINNTESAWHLLGSHDERQKIPIHQPKLQSDNLSLLKEASLAGMGVSGLPLYACMVELQAGTLKTILPQWRPKAGHLVVLFPSRRGLAPAVRVFVDFLKAQLPDLLEHP